MSWGFGEFELTEPTRELRSGAGPISLEPQVFDVLAYLIANRDRVVSKEELLDNVWGSRFVSESALTSRIKDARRAIGDDGRAQRFIKTFHGRGYRFVHLVTEGQPQPDLSPAHEGDSPAVRTDLSLAVDREFAFVGRVDTIERAIDLGTGAATAPRTLLLGGEPGIGKSRVALEVANRMASDHGYSVIGGRCEQHLATSLQPWLEALSSYVDLESEAQLAEDTSGVLDHLRPFLPVLDTRLGLDEPVVNARNDEYAVIDAIVTLIERVSSRRPLVIVLDDIQWGGGATRSLASLLLRRRVAHVFLILTFRTTIDDLGVATREWLEALQRSGARREDLVGLTVDDVAALITDVLGPAMDDELTHEIWSRSSGLALFAVELLRDLRRGGQSGELPASVSALVQSRLNRLTPDVADLVTAGAALGQEFDLAVAAAVAGLDDRSLLDALDGALGAQLLHEVSDPVDWYRFSHQLVPAAALDSMSSSRRIRLHATVVTELERRSAPQFQIAHHLLEASPLLDLGEVVARVRTTSEAALREHQYDRAIELLERAAQLDIDPRLRAEVLTRYGSACNLAGQQPRALTALTRAADLARTNRWDDLLAEAALGLWGQSPFRASRDQTVIPLIDEAIERTSEGDAATRARLLAKRAAFMLFSGRLEERDLLSAQAVELVGDDVSPARLEVLEARWMAIASPLMLDQVVELDEELEQLRNRLSALTTDASAPEISLYWRGMGDELAELAAARRDDPRQRRDVDQWRTTALSGAFALFSGDLDDARLHADRALPLSEEPWGEAGRVVHALVHLLVDVLDPEIAATNPEQLGRWSQIEQLVPSDSMRATRAWAVARWGDPHVADGLIDHVIPRIGLLPENYMGGFGLIGLSEAALLMQRDDLFGQLITVLQPLSGQMLGHPWAPSLAAADPLARLHRAVGDEQSAREATDQARKLYEGLGAWSLQQRVASIAG